MVAMSAGSGTWSRPSRAPAGARAPQSRRKTVPRTSPLSWLARASGRRPGRGWRTQRRGRQGRRCTRRPRCGRRRRQTRRSRAARSRRTGSATVIPSTTRVLTRSNAGQRGSGIARLRFAIEADRVEAWGIWFSGIVATSALVYVARSFGREGKMQRRRRLQPNGRRRKLTLALRCRTARVINMSTSIAISRRFTSRSATTALHPNIECHREADISALRLVMEAGQAWGLPDNTWLPAVVPAAQMPCTGRYRGITFSSHAN